MKKTRRRLHKKNRSRRHRGGRAYSSNLKKVQDTLPFKEDTINDNDTPEVYRLLDRYLEDTENVENSADDVEPIREIQKLFLDAYVKIKEANKKFEKFMETTEALN